MGVRPQKVYYMRTIQVGLLILATLVLIFAAVNWTTIIGLILWRVGIAMLLVDIVALMLWPTKPGNK